LKEGRAPAFRAGAGTHAGKFPFASLTTHDVCREFLTGCAFLVAAGTTAVLIAPLVFHEVPLVFQEVDTCSQQWPEGYCLSLALHQGKVCWVWIFF